MVRKIKESITNGSKEFPFYNTTNAYGGFSGICPLCGCGAAVEIYKAKLTVNDDKVIVPCVCDMCGTTFNDIFEYADSVVVHKGNVDINDQAYQYRLKKLNK